VQGALFSSIASSWIMLASEASVHPGADVRLCGATLRNNRYARDPSL
jgi:hypothetical protein